MENVVAPSSSSLLGEDPLSEPSPRSLSGVAAGLARGVRRHMALAGYASLLEVPLRSGRRADVMALGPKAEIVIVEVKSGPQDFRTDRKWPEYRDFCDRLYFAVGAAFPHGLIPDGVGLLCADPYGAEILREAPAHPLLGARRKAVTIRFGRLAAARLQAILDPEDVPRM